MGRTYFFVSALSPAVIISSIRAFELIGAWAWVGVVIGLLSFFATPALLQGRERVTARVTRPIAVSDKTLGIPSYLITFVFPFLFLSETPSVYTLIAYGVFGLLLVLLLFRSDLGLVNPALLVLGYRLYEVETEFEELIVISRRRVRKNESLKVHLLSGNYYLDANGTEE